MKFSNLDMYFVVTTLTYGFYVNGITINPSRNIHRSENSRHFASAVFGSSSEKHDVTFPPPLTKLDRMKRALSFWTSTAPIVSDYFIKLIELKMLDLNGMGMPIEEKEAFWNSTHENGAKRLTDTISDMKGFYTKAAQIVATRGDLFPVQYTEQLKQFQDNLDPMPAAMVKQIVMHELIGEGKTFEDVFSYFDDKQPLGSASIAQVHHAVLSEKYCFREVAVKVQRPSIESKLMGDVANLKMIAKIFRDLDASPVDYFSVFSELEVQMKNEFDFCQEANAMDAIYNSLAHDSNGNIRELPVVIPRPVPELVTSRVLVMDYVKGTPLSRAQQDLESIKAGSVKSKLFGTKFLESLSKVFGTTILESGFFHADIHPGNIMVTDTGDIGIIDFGQVKQLSSEYCETIAKIIVALNDRKNGGDEMESNKILQQLVFDLGVELKEDAQPEAGAAIAMWLFDGSVTQLPGGYDTKELSSNAPIKDIKEFPQDLVLVARSVMLIKAFSNRFQIRWSLAEQWGPIAQKILYGSNESRVMKTRVRPMFPFLRFILYSRRKVSTLFANTIFRIISLGRRDS